MTLSSPRVAILNPRAAGGRAKKVWARIAPALEQRLGAVESRFTQFAGHATELAAEALREGSDLVIAVGGDGTVNEVANGFFRDDQPLNPDSRLGLIPIGTGGDLQRSLGIPRDVGAAAEIVATGQTLAVDVGRADFAGHQGEAVCRYFVNLLSFGMGGEVAVRAKNFLMPLGGKVAFLYATFVVFLRYRGKRVRLTLDDTPVPEELLIANIAVGNGEYHGGGMHPCPRAVMNDGLLEVTTIDRLSMFELMRDLPMLYSDDVYRHPKVRHFRAKRIRAESDEPTRIEVDGEALGQLPLEVRLLPKALRILVPQGSGLLRG